MAIELADPHTAAFIVALLIVSGPAMYFFYKRPKLNVLRRVPALDAIEDIVKSCAERGKGIHVTPGANVVASQGWAMPGAPTFVPALTSICKSIAKSCGDLNIPLRVSSCCPNFNLLLLDATRQGYVESAHPERFDPTLFTQSPDYRTAQTTQINLIEGGTLGGHIAIGFYWCTQHLPLVEACARHGVTQLFGLNFPDLVAPCVIGSDYAPVSGEISAAGAYLSKDPLQAASLLGQDIMYIFIIGWLLVLSAAFLLGVWK